MKKIMKYISYVDRTQDYKGKMSNPVSKSPPLHRFQGVRQYLNPVRDLSTGEMVFCRRKESHHCFKAQNKFFNA